MTPEELRPAAGDEPPKPPSTIADAVEEAINLGWRVFPLWPRSVRVADPDWLQNATCDRYEARDAVERIRNSNLALALGRPSGVFALEIVEAEAADTARAVFDLPDTWQIKGPADERWLLYRFPEPAKIWRRPSLTWARPHADGTWVPLPPSETTDGLFTWQRSSELPAEAPPVLMHCVFGGNARDETYDDRRYSFAHADGWRRRREFIEEADSFAQALSVPAQRETAIRTFIATLKEAGEELLASPAQLLDWWMVLGNAFSEELSDDDSKLAAQALSHLVRGGDQ